MNVTAFVLPYHLHSFQITQIIPLLTDVCNSDSTKCVVDQYSTLCHDNLEWILDADAISENEFMQKWSEIVVKTFPGVVTQDQILALFQPDDTHKSNRRVRNDFDYAAAIGVNGTPQAFVNGVMLDSYPQSQEAWITLFSEMFPA